MSAAYSPSELEAYLDEALAPEAMAAIEAALRCDHALAEQLMAINGRRDAGLHSLGEIWRRHRVSCPNRQQLQSFLLDVLETGHADYIRWHVAVVGCRLCQANLDDLGRLQSEQAAQTSQRRQKYFQSSAGLLKRP